MCVEWRAQNAEAAAAPAAAPTAAMGAAAGAPAPGASPFAAPVARAAAAPAIAPGVITDFCSFPGQICSTNGTLLRLDMRGFNLQCPFPEEAMTAFTGLTTINLGRNPNMTVRLAPGAPTCRGTGAVRASCHNSWAQHKRKFQKQEQNLY